MTRIMTNGYIRAVLIKESGMERARTPEYIMAHSPTDSSEDSVEVKVEAITGRPKRKLTEPRRISDGPLKKRTCIRSEDSAPFRPWNIESPTKPESELPPRHLYFRPPSPIQPASPQPVDLIKKPKIELTPAPITIKQEPGESRVPIHPDHTDSILDCQNTITSSIATFPKLHPIQQQQLSPIPRKEQRNYKNMTRERRIEANARERTRVHTISAAFDTLRKSVPAYSHSQKLSKLSVLRIACSYISTLSNMLEGSPHVSQSVENVSRTIQREGKLRKKKDED